MYLQTSPAIADEFARYTLYISVRLGCICLRRCVRLSNRAPELPASASFNSYGVKLPVSDLNPAMYAGVEDTSLPEDELTQQENTRYHLDTMVFGVAYNLSAFAIVFLLLLLYGKTAEMRIVLLLLAALSRVHHARMKCI